MHRPTLRPVHVLVLTIAEADPEPRALICDRSGDLRGSNGYILDLEAPSSPVVRARKNKGPSLHLSRHADESQQQTCLLSRSIVGDSGQRFGDRQVGTALASVQAL